MKTFSDNLKFLREEKKITQKEISKYLEISANSYQRYEYGTREPDLLTLKQISCYFNVPADFLLGNGVFSNWGDIIKYKKTILDCLSKVFPNEIGLISTDISIFIRFLSSTIREINIDNTTNTISIHFFLDELTK